MNLKRQEVIRFLKKDPPRILNFDVRARRRVSQIKSEKKAVRGPFFSLSNKGSLL
jgi:hypothetical protein